MSDDSSDAPDLYQPVAHPARQPRSAGDKLAIVLALTHRPTRELVYAAVRQHSDLEIIAETMSGNAAYTLCLAQPADLFICELSLLNLDGISATYLLNNSLSHHIPVLMLSRSENMRVLQTALQAGVTGYLRPSVAPDVLAAIMRAVARGTVVVDEQLASEFVVYLARNPEQENLTPWRLNSFDRKLLSLLAAGISVARIAALLDLQPCSIYARLRRIYRKFGLANRAALLDYAAEFGLITSSSLNLDAVNVFPGEST